MPEPAIRTMRRALRAALAWAVVCQAVSTSWAADVTKANNANNLNLGTSWASGTAPTASDVAVWNSTVTAANATAYGANIAWQGVRIVNPGGLVTLGSTGSTTTLTLGSAGIDMSAATQNLLLNGNISVSGSQSWQVANARTLQLFTANTDRTMVGSGTMYLTNATGSGTATFDLRPGSNGSTAFTAQAGVSGYTGSWWIGSNTVVKTLRNGINAWGNGGTVFLAGGVVGQQLNFSGAWTNTMELVANSTSTIDDFNTSGSRYLQLNGVIQGSGNLVIQDSNASVSMSKDITYTIAAANTMSGTVTVAAGSFLRVGGVGGSTNSAAGGVPSAGTQGTLGTAAVVVNSTGGLAFTRTDAVTVANAISGAGVVYVGSANANLAATSTQDLTLSSSNSYSGGTEVLSGTLNVSALSGIGSGYLAVKNAATFIYTGSGTETTTRNLFLDSGSATISVSNASGWLAWNDSSAKNQAFTKTGVGGLEIGGTFGGSASVRLNGGTLRLTSANSAYSGATTLVAGTLEASKLAAGGANSSIGASGTAAANLVFNGGVLSYIGTGDSTDRSFTISSAPTINANGSGALEWTGGSPTFTTANTAYRITLGGTSTAANTWGTILADNGSGATSVRKAGTGTWVLSGANTFTGTVGIVAGTLELGAAGTLGSGSFAGTVTNEGVLSVATSADQVLAGAISGSGSLSKAGAGKLTLSAVNTYAGNTTITSGTVELAGAGQLGAGSYAGAIANDGTLRVATSANQSLTGGISGGGAVLKEGSGRLTLGGVNSYAGTTNVSAGTLLVDGRVTASTITVAGATLGGSGTTAAVALVGGVISPGNSPGTLTVGDLAWDATSSYDWEIYDSLGTAGSTTGWDLISGTGALTVTGTGFTFNLLSMSGTNARGPLAPERWSQTTSGTFRIANFASISAPSGTWWTLNSGSFTPYSATLGTFSLDVQSNSIDLVYTYTPPPAYTWTTGSGSWSTAANWSTDPLVPAGTAELIFAGAGGTATNDLVSGTAAGELTTVTGLTFSGSAAGAYTLDGNAFSLGSIGIVNQSAAVQTVQNGLTLAASSLADADTAGLLLSGTLDTAGFLFTVAGAANSTLAGRVTGAGGVTKIGTGQLRLTGPNDYTGVTTVSSGTVVVGDGGTAGVLPGDVTNNAALVFDRTDAVTYGGVISGTGGVAKLNASTLTLTGNSTSTGLLTIAGGTVQVGDGGTGGGIVGDVANGGVLLFNRGNASTYGGTVTGTGSLVKFGAGTLSLTGAGSHTGGTLISAGALQIGAGGTAGGLSGDVTNDAVLAFNRSDAITFAGIVSGSGSLTQAGAGATTLTAVNTYAGSTTISSGTLVIGGAGQLGGGFYASGIANAGVLSVATSADQTFSGTVSGVGSLRKAAAGTLTLTAANTFSGGMTIDAGRVRAGDAAALGTGTATLNGGGLSADGTTARTLGNAVVFGGDVTLGDVTDTGLLTFTGNVGLGNATRQLTTPSNVTLSGTLANGGLTKAGAGVLTLSASNSYVAGTTLSAGRIRIGANAALGTGTVTLNSGALSSDGGTARAPTNALAIGGDVTLGDTVDAGAVTFSGGVNLGGAVRQVTTPSDVTMWGVLTNGGITKAGAATLTLTAASTFAGATTVSSGTLKFTGSGNIGSSSGVSIAAGAALDWARAAGMTTAITGSGTVVRSTSGNAVFSGANSAFAGNWSILNGYVGLAGDSTLGVPGVGITMDGGGIYFTTTGNTLAATRTVTLLAGGGYLNGSTGNTNTFAATFTGTGGLNKVSGETAVLTGTSDFTGGITITGGGALEIGGAGKLGGSAGIYNGAIGNVNSLVFSTSQNQTLGGVISNIGSLTKSGVGTLTVTATNTYSGATTVSAGRLLVDGRLASTSGVSIAASGTLGGSGSIAATLSGAGLVSPGTSPGITTANAVNPTGGLDYAFEFTATGSPTYGSPAASVNDVLRLTAATAFTASLTGTNVVDVYFDVPTLVADDTFRGGFYVDAGGDFIGSVQNATYRYWVRGGGTGTDATFNGQGYFSLANFDAAFTVTRSTVPAAADFGSGTVNGSVTQFVVVPEPATIGLVAIGGLMAGWWIWKRRRVAAILDHRGR